MLKYTVGVLAFLLLLATVLWGFPGVWALPAIVPSFILGATIAHVRRPRDGRDAVATGGDGKPPPGGVFQGTPPGGVRPAVVVLGGMFGLATAGASMALAWAAAAPATIVVEASKVIDAPVRRVWAEVGDPYRRTAWDQWVADLEPVGKGVVAGVGAEYRTVLRLDRIEVPALQRLVAFDPEREVAWSIAPQGGSTLENLRQTIRIEAQGNEKTLVHYAVSYDVPSVLGRVGERIAVRGGVERMTESTLEKLRNVAMGLE